VRLLAVSKQTGL